MGRTGGEPYPVSEKVLEILKRYDAKATFFCIGKKIEPNCEVFKQIITFGHTLGNHSFRHNDNFSLLLPSRMREEIERFPPHRLGKMQTLYSRH
mgnify:CR=1 FL=1